MPKGVRSSPLGTPAQRAAARATLAALPEKYRVDGYIDALIVLEQIVRGDFGPFDPDDKTEFVSVACCHAWSTRTPSKL